MDEILLLLLNPQNYPPLKSLYYNLHVYIVTIADTTQFTTAVWSQYPDAMCKAILQPHHSSLWPHYSPLCEAIPWPHSYVEPIPGPLHPLLCGATPVSFTFIFIYK